MFPNPKGTEFNYNTGYVLEMWEMATPLVELCTCRKRTEQYLKTWVVLRPLLRQ